MDLKLENTNTYLNFGQKCKKKLEKTLESNPKNKTQRLKNGMENGIFV
jgi:hypothetical protein